MIIEIPFEPFAKRAPQAAHNYKTKIPIIRDPDFDRKKDISEWISANCKLPIIPFSGPLEIFFLFKVPLPTAISKKELKQRMDFLWATDCKKDLDNMQKLYQDILNFGVLKGKIFHDDHLICNAKTTKIWSTIPGILISISEIESPYCVGL